jgi:hypothetical protein
MEDAECEFARYGKRNVRKWYAALESGQQLRLPDYRVIAGACGMITLDTPSANKSGEEARPEFLGEYALKNRRDFRVLPS